MIEFKFLQKEPEDILQYSFITFTNLYNRLDIVQLPWKRYTPRTEEPSEFRGTFNQFRSFYLRENFIPTLYDVSLKRNGWIRNYYSIDRRLNTRILKNDKLLIYYGRL